MVTGVLTTSYPRFADDGAGAFVADRVAVLRAGGHEVEVLAAGDGETAGPAGVAKGDPSFIGDGGGRRAGVASGMAAGETITRVAAVFGGSRLFYGAGAPEVLERAGPGTWLAAARFTSALAGRVMARRGVWTAVESHWLVPCGLVATALLPGLPHRAFAHSGDVALLERLPAGAALAWLLARSGAELCFVSDDLRRRFGRLAGRLVGQVVRLGPPPALFAPPTAEARASARLGSGLLDGQRLLIGVGRLVPIKGWDVLVDALACMPAALRPCAVVLGDGPLRQVLVARSARRGVELALPGALTRVEVARWLRAADVAVQPSRPLPVAHGWPRTEGLPLSALEALAVGLPLVASATGGLAELGAEPRVSLVPPDAPLALALALTAQLSCLAPAA